MRDLLQLVRTARAGVQQIQYGGIILRLSTGAGIGSGNRGLVGTNDLGNHFSNSGSLPGSSTGCRVGAIAGRHIIIGAQIRTCGQTQLGYDFRLRLCKGQTRLRGPGGCQSREWGNGGAALRCSQEQLADRSPASHIRSHTWNRLQHQRCRCVIGSQREVASVVRLGLWFARIAGAAEVQVNANQCVGQISVDCHTGDLCTVGLAAAAAAGQRHTDDPHSRQSKSKFA